MALAEDERSAWLERVRGDPHELRVAPAAVRCWPKAVLAAVERQPDVLGLAAPALLDDPDFVCACVQIDGSLLKYASEAVRARPEVVRAAVERWPRALGLASPALRGDRRFVLEAVRLRGAALAGAAGGLRGDRGVVLQAVQADGLALEFAEQALRADPAVVRAALKQNALAIRHAAAAIQGSPIWKRTATIRAENRAAVAGERADEVFEGYVGAGARRCIVSFPGAFVMQWDGLVRRCRDKALCSACVFLPKSDPKGRFGMHAEDPGAPPRCYCCSLYGSPKPWGCRWFVDWMQNVEAAVDLGLELYVVFFPGETNEGVVAWRDLAAEGKSLWNNVGLGGSQKAEVAWLKLKGCAFQSIDVLDADSIFGLADGKAETLDLGRPVKGDAVRIIAGRHKGRTGKLLTDDGSDKPAPYRVIMEGDKAKAWFTESEVMLAAAKGQ